jgi:hypothetical protein
LDDLPNLSTLDLSENHIEAISGLDALISLTTVNLADNNILRLRGLGTLILLESLNVEDNPIYNWVVEEFGIETGNIAKLAVSYCKQMRDIIHISIPEVNENP